MIRFVKKQMALIRDSRILEHPERSRQVQGFMRRDLNRSLSLRPNRDK